MLQASWIRRQSGLRAFRERQPWRAKGNESLYIAPSALGATALAQLFLDSDGNLRCSGLVYRIESCQKVVSHSSCYAGNTMDGSLIARGGPARSAFWAYETSTMHEHERSAGVLGIPDSKYRCKQLCPCLPKQHRSCQTCDSVRRALTSCQVCTLHVLTLVPLLVIPSTLLIHLIQQDCSEQLGSMTACHWSQSSSR